MPATKKTTNRISDNGQHEEVVRLRPMVKKTLQLTLRGTTSLIVHKFSEKAKKSIEEKQQKKAKAAKEARDPKAEYLAAFYVMPSSKKKAGEKGCRYGIPAAGFKNAAVSACTWIDGKTKVSTRGDFHVLEDEAGLVEVKSKAGPRMREDTVRLAGPGGTLDLRYRPEFPDWSCDVRVLYNASAITPEQIVNLFSVAGFAVGMCEWRPEKNGSYGMFEVETQ